MTGMQAQRRAHKGLVSGDDRGFSSLRHSGPPRAERYALGRQLRRKAPRPALGDWIPPSDRQDVVDQVMRSNDGRLDWLIPVRVGRMIASPYAFLRGAASVHAADFAALPATGITPVVCGDAHLGNFGFYASPERSLVFDLNDFDEAHPGAWEWDLRRLTTSVWVAGRENGTSETECGAAVATCVEEYRRQIAALAHQPPLARSYEHLDVDRLLRTVPRTDLPAPIGAPGPRATGRTATSATACGRAGGGAAEPRWGDRPRAVARGRDVAALAWVTRPTGRADEWSPGAEKPPSISRAPRVCRKRSSTG